MSFFSNPERIPENYGIRIGLGLMAFFGVMYLLGLANIVELRMLNLIILGIGVYSGLKKFKESQDKHINYFRALATGVTISTIGSFIFSGFLFFFMKFNSGFMQWIVDNEPMGIYLFPLLQK